MKEFIEFIVKQLVDKPEAVVVREKVSEEKKVIFSLKVEQNDIGKIIGKQGRTAIAMRTLLTAVAAKQGKKAILDIEG
ncbi:MAG: KH domain-containing protein [Ignavibacteriaceae bacterium]|jgi:hypothetical protein